MIMKTVAFLCKTVSTNWYTTKLGIQIHCKWLDYSNLSIQTRPYINSGADLGYVESVGLTNIFFMYNIY